jgi:hypothetical protein
MPKVYYQDNLYADSESTCHGALLELPFISELLAVDFIHPALSFQLGHFPFTAPLRTHNFRPIDDIQPGHSSQSKLSGPKMFDRRQDFPAKQSCAGALARL